LEVNCLAWEPAVRRRAFQRAVRAAAQRGETLRAPTRSGI